MRAIHSYGPNGGGGGSSTLVVRLAVALMLLVGINGCSRVSHSELLTAEEFRTVEERRSAELALQMVPILEEQQQIIREQERRLQTLDRRLEMILARVNELDRSRRQMVDGKLVDGEASGDGDDPDSDEAAADEEPEFDQAYLSNDDPLVFGAHECIAFPEQSLVLRARIDSGANTASLSAKSIREFERDGEPWVRFRMGEALHEGEKDDEDENDDARNRENDESGDSAAVLEEIASLVDDSLDSDMDEPSSGESNESVDGDNDAEKGSGDGVGIEVEAPIERTVIIRQASGDERRFVVRLPIRLGPLRQRADFTLTDRADMTYPVLIGRRLMMDVAVIDVAREYVQSCPTNR